MGQLVREIVRAVGSKLPVSLTSYSVVRCCPRLRISESRS